jgi:uncharacterized membrane protein YhaH (DUF805 family)
LNIQKLYLDRGGRIPRKVWWLATIGLIVIAIIIQLVVGMIGGVLGLHKTLFGQGLMSLAVIAAIYVPYYAITVKRLHDRARPASLFYAFVAPSVAIAAGSLLGVTGSMQEVEIFGQKALVQKYNMLGNALNLAGFAVGLWSLVELGFLRGQSGSNPHGPDPLA